MSKQEKSNSQRIYDIVRIAKEHFGHDEVKFVGVKYEDGIGWIAKLKMHSFSSIVCIDETDTGAIKKLKSSIKSIKRRYETI